MYLWQIRHIPNRPQILLKLTIAASMFAIDAVSPYLAICSAAAQAEKGDSNVAETAEQDQAAKEFFERVRQELPKHQTVKADLSQSVSIGEQQFKVSGTYVSAGPKLKLSYSLLPEEGAKAELLEICDGKELWTMLSMADKKSVTHRNVQQIMDAASAAHKRGATEVELNVELGLGGLTALLASVERAMDFVAMKEESVEGHSRTIVQGRLKDRIAKMYQKNKDDPLPVFLPRRSAYASIQRLFFLSGCNT